MRALRRTVPRERIDAVLSLALSTYSPFLIGLAGLCFLQFLGSLRGALARAEGEPARITTAAIASGAAFIALATASHAVGTAVSWSVRVGLAVAVVFVMTVKPGLLLSLIAVIAGAAAGLAASVVAARQVQST